MRVGGWEIVQGRGDWGRNEQKSRVEFGWGARPVGEVVEGAGLVEFLDVPG